MTTKQNEFNNLIQTAIDLVNETQAILESAAAINDSVSLTLAQHDAQNLLDKLRNLKRHNEERQIP